MNTGLLILGVTTASGVFGVVWYVIERSDERR